MLEFSVSRCTRRCERSDRELRAGESYYSVLVPAGSDVRRVDFSAEHWDGPPENAIGWWQSKMPDPTDKKLDWAPHDVILHYFDQLENQAESQDTRYVLALFMVRRRLFRIEETETNEQGQQVMIFFCPKNDTEYRVVVAEPSPDRIETIQNELANLLVAGGG